MLGERVRERRENLELSPAELVERTGIDKSTLSRIENEKVMPAADKVAILAAHLDTTSDYLLGLTDDPEPRAIRRGITPYEQMIINALRRGDAMKAIQLISGVGV